MQPYPPDRFATLLARIEPRPWHTAARFLLHSERAAVQVDDIARPQAVAILWESGAYFVPLGNPTALLDFLAEEPAVTRIWVSDRAAAHLVAGTMLGEDAAPVTILAAGDGWSLTPLDTAHLSPRTLTPDDAHALTALLAGGGEWLTGMFGSAAALLAEGSAVGVEHEGRLVSVAATWTIAPPYAEVGAHTDPAARRRGYATVCVHRLMELLTEGGIRPQWTSFRDDNALAHRFGLTPADSGVEYRREE